HPARDYPLGKEPGRHMSLFEQVARWFADGSHWQGDFGIPNRLLEHVELSGASILAAAIIALPIGIGLGHLRRGGIVAINVANVGRAVPSFALLVIAFELVGLGWPPAFIALVALGIPPMVRSEERRVGKESGSVWWRCV